MSVYLQTPWERAASAWEHGTLDVCDRATLDLPTAQAVVDHAYGLFGLPKRPPTVERVGRDQAGYVSGALASASQDGLFIRLYQPCNTVTLLHEVVHHTVESPLDRMELRPLQEQEFHGKLFLGNYLWVLDRLMGPKFNTFRLRATMPALLEPHTLPYHPVVWGVPRPDL